MSEEKKCPRTITPRFTRPQYAALTSAARLRIDALEDQLGDNVGNDKTFRKIQREIEALEGALDAIEEEW